jgi:hypothetical protein
METNSHLGNGIKFVKFFGHPLLLIIAFLTLPFDAYNIDGLYVNIIIDSIAQGRVYSILAVAGVVILLLTWIIFGRKYNHSFEFIANFLGSYSLLISFMLYSWQQLEAGPDKTAYRNQALLFLNFIFIMINFMQYYFHRLEGGTKAEN